MPLLVAALVLVFCGASLGLAEIGLYPALAALLSIPLSFAVAFALSRIMRSAGVI